MQKRLKLNIYMYSFFPLHHLQLKALCQLCTFFLQILTKKGADVLWSQYVTKKVSPL